MAEPTITRRFGKLAGAYPVAGTPTRLYTCPQETSEFPNRTAQTAIAKIRIANNGVVSTFGIWIGNVDEVRGNNATVAYPTLTTIPAAGSPLSIVEIIAGDGLQNGAWIDVQSGNGSISFQLFGEETVIDP